MKILSISVIATLGLISPHAAMASGLSWPQVLEQLSATCRTQPHEEHSILHIEKLSKHAKVFLDDFLQYSTGDAPIECRVHALLAIGAIGPLEEVLAAKVVRGVVSLFRDPELRKTALATIYSMGPAANNELILHLASDNVDERGMTHNALLLINHETLESRSQLREFDADASSAELQSTVQPAKAVTALARACGESDTGPGSARSAPALAAAYPER
jgi:hypothetical protein